MHIELIYIIGASGHGKVVLDAILAAGVKIEKIRVRDGSSALAGSRILGCPIETPSVVSLMSGQNFHLAIGSISTRQRLFMELTKLGATPLSIIHPRSCVSSFSKIANGTFIAALAIVAPLAQVGQCVIVNHGAIIDHDCLVDDFSHIAPNVTLGGGVKIGKGVLIGAGATILPGVMVGAGSIIGAGAVVTTDVASGEIFAGVPAVFLKKKKLNET